MRRIHHGFALEFIATICLPRMRGDPPALMASATASVLSTRMRGDPPTKDHVWSNKNCLPACAGIHPREPALNSACSFYLPACADPPFVGKTSGILNGLLPACAGIQFPLISPRFSVIDSLFRIKQKDLPLFIQNFLPPVFVSVYSHARGSTPYRVHTISVFSRLPRMCADPPFGELQGEGGVSFPTACAGIHLQENP